VQLSGERVLTMEWIDGCKLTDMGAIVAMHVHPRDVALELLHAFGQMTFVDGFGALLPLGDPCSDCCLPICESPSLRRLISRGGSVPCSQDPLTHTDHI